MPAGAKVAGRVSEQVVSISQIINVGVELKAELERAAREENGDATWLARKILREWLAARAPLT
jgi:hypothetical protein